MIEQPTRLIASVTPSALLLHGPENVINYPDIWIISEPAIQTVGRVLVLLSRKLLL